MPLCGKLCRRLLHISSVRFQCLPLTVNEADLKTAELAVSKAATNLHRLQISHHILNLSKPRSTVSKNRLYAKLLSYVDISDASIVSQSNELMCESISKCISVTDPLTHHTCKITFNWNCERHNNPHMDINEFQSKMKTQFDSGEDILLFEVSRYDKHCDTVAMQKLFDFLEQLLTNIPDVQECYSEVADDRGRDMGWFITFLCCHPSDHAFDVASMYLMPNTSRSYRK